MKRSLRALLASSVIFAVAACEPRGETISLPQVLENSKKEFSTAVGALDAKTVGELKPQLERINTLLDTMTSEKGAASLAQTSEEIAKILSQLTAQAGYTSRPALGEIAAQFREVQESISREAKGAQESLSALKLLASRTYSLLASELQGVKFGLKEREMKP